MVEDGMMLMPPELRDLLQQSLPVAGHIITLRFNTEKDRVHEERRRPEYHAHHYHEQERGYHIPLQYPILPYLGLRGSQEERGTQPGGKRPAYVPPHLQEPRQENKQGGDKLQPVRYEGEHGPREQASSGGCHLRCEYLVKVLPEGHGILLEGGVKIRISEHPEIHVPIILGKNPLPPQKNFLPQ